jgi:phosphoribosylanthranilate isomerase
MSVWIKICGNTSLADARAAVEAGADAVGFVFAPSPRQVTVAQAAAICGHLPETVERIGVFVDAELEEIYSTVRTCRLSGVQLHFETRADLPGKLHERLGSWLRILRVAHFEVAVKERLAAEIGEHARNLHLDAVLVDSRTATAVGGTGTTFDWAAARESIFADMGTLKLIVAGGLNASNVTEAIATLRPWGVDVVSGVEASPGRKDSAKVHEFVARVRAVPISLP